MEVVIVKKDESEKERVAGSAMAVIIGKMQTATPKETVSLSKELFFWYGIMWPNDSDRDGECRPQ